MACHGCATKFGFFEKELGCPCCGFAYCKKCLRFEGKDPEKKDSTRKVCVKCHIKHAEMEIKPSVMDMHADKFKKCIETMCETEPKAKYEFKDPKLKFPSLKDGFDHETQQLADRLKSLESDYKKTWPKLKTDEEIAARLNEIQGRPSTSKEPIPAYKSPKSCTETEETDTLMQQFMEETALDSRLPKPELEIEARLARLRGEKTEKKVNIEEDMSFMAGAGKPKGVWGLDIPEDNSDEEEKAAQSIVKKALLDAQLKTDLEKMNDIEIAELEEQKELPWCVICNEDATQRCVDCDGDLYCDACFIECCKPEDHLSEPFVKDNNSSISKESSDHNSQL